LKKFPEIEKIVGKTGSSEIPTDPMPIDASDMMIILKPRSEWTSAQSYDELSEKCLPNSEKHDWRYLFFSISCCYAF
jgi:cobalt-zinc-cadmium resistance protein CzcA